MLQIQDNPVQCCCNAMGVKITTVSTHNAGCEVCLSRVIEQGGIGQSHRGYKTKQLHLIYPKITVPVALWLACISSYSNNKNNNKNNTFQQWAMLPATGMLFPSMYYKNAMCSFSIFRHFTCELIGFQQIALCKCWNHGSQHMLQAVVIFVLQNDPLISVAMQWVFIAQNICISVL